MLNVLIGSYLFAAASFVAAWPFAEYAQRLGLEKLYRLIPAMISIVP
jgi:hypothetical protein